MKTSHLQICINVFVLRYSCSRCYCPFIWMHVKLTHLYFSYCIHIFTYSIAAILFYIHGYLQLYTSKCWIPEENTVLFFCWHLHFSNYIHNVTFPVRTVSVTCTCAHRCWMLKNNSCVRLFWSSLTGELNIRI